MSTILSVLTHILCLGLILRLHVRLRRLEPARDPTPQKPKAKCWGFLCKGGELPDGHPCPLCKGGTQAPSYPNPDRPQTLTDPPDREHQA